MKKSNMMEDWGYYPSMIFVYSILYFSLNMLDLITTKIALETCDHVYELNPLYYHPFFALLKPYAPVCLLTLYLSLYFIKKSEPDRRIIGKCGLGCVMLLVFLYELICLNNIYHIYSGF